MSGILDSKSRIIDAILTLEGRRQMADGKFDVSYVTFTDADVGYIADTEEGHVDPAGKIYFEACNLPQDQVTFEANDEGALVPFRYQDIKVTPSELTNAPVNWDDQKKSLQGTLSNGKLTIYRYHNGRRIKVQTNTGVPSDKDKGFIYSDTTSLTASILIDPDLKAGSILVETPAPGGPYRGYIGTFGGLGPIEFAQTISSSIAQIGIIGGPQVPVSVSGDSVYLDGPGASIDQTILLASGTLSNPFVLEEAVLGGSFYSEEVQSAAFATQIQGILTSSLDNFRDLQCLSTIDTLFEDQNFELSRNEIRFDLSKTSAGINFYANSDDSASNTRNLPAPRLSVIDSMFSDEKFSNLINFKYLPPIVKVSDSVVTDKKNIDNVRPFFLGNYVPWGDNEKLTMSRLLKNVEKFGDIHPPVVLNKTSLKNNVIAQIFEITDDAVTKLDIFRYGKAQDKVVYFVGKTFIDDRGTTVFVNIFTFILSRYDREANTSLIETIRTRD